MPRRSRADQELNWLRSVWEVLAAAELSHGAFITISIKPTAMRSRFYVKFEMTRPETPGGMPPFHGAVTNSYPSSSATQFLPWLWNMSEQFVAFIDNDDPGVKPQGEWRRG